MTDTLLTEVRMWGRTIGAAAMHANGSKVHMQSLGAIAHIDFNLAGAYSYEQALLVMRQLQLPMDAIEQQYRRMVFNVLARNQDDHVKNIAFLMSQDGTWSLAPAFDITYSYNPHGLWTNAHQMSINGKRDHFTAHDLSEVARVAHMHAPRARRIVQEVTAVVQRWPEFAAHAAIPEADVVRIQRTHRDAFT